MSAAQRVKFTCPTCPEGHREKDYANDKWIVKCLWCKKLLMCFNCQMAQRSKGLKAKDYSYCSDCANKEHECVNQLCGRPILKPHKWDDSSKEWILPSVCWNCAEAESFLG